MNSTQFYLRNVFYILVIIIISGCTTQHDIDEKRAKGPLELSLKEYYESGNRHRNQLVTIPGFLISQKDVLHLDVSPSSWGPQYPTLLILDTTPSREVGLEIVYQSHKCTEQYVKITGILGQIPSPNAFGMVYIHEIRVFDNQSFQGKGEVCYTIN